MYVRSEHPHHQSRVASGCGNLAPPPGLDHRNGQKPNQCVNRFQILFLSELVLHYNVVASYRYDPFGNLISSSGSLANDNIYRFSSKEFHAASGMYYYGFRFYDPNLQRWINRDPFSERGGYNLFAFVSNNPLFFVDPFGLDLNNGNIDFNPTMNFPQPPQWDPFPELHPPKPPPKLPRDDDYCPNKPLRRPPWLDRARHYHEPGLPPGYYIGPWPIPVPQPHGPDKYGLGFIFYGHLPGDPGGW